MPLKLSLSRLRRQLSATSIGALLAVVQPEPPSDEGGGYEVPGGRDMSKRLDRVSPSVTFGDSYPQPQSARFHAAARIARFG